MKEFHLIRIHKPVHKFAAAHMTVFPDGTKERLHGHNFEVTLQVRILKTPVKEMISFSVFNSALKDLCAVWDEKVIVARHCPYLVLHSESNVQVEFSLCKKHYNLPAEDVAWIDSDNVTTEALAETFCHAFLARIRGKIASAQLGSVAITVDEIPGQGSTYEWMNPEWA